MHLPIHIPLLRPGGFSNSGKRTVGNKTGAVLLEVVLALVLFVAAATVISSAFNASLLALDRLRLNTRAANFSATVLAELQIGIRPIVTAGPEPFEVPYEGWSWEIAVSTADEGFTSTSQLRRVEVIIRHAESALVHRLAQLINAPEQEMDESDLFLTGAADDLSGQASASSFEP